MQEYKKLFKNINLIFLGNIVAVLIYNIIILKTASGNVVPDQPYYYVQKQVIWIIAGFILMLLTACIDYHLYPKLLKLLYGFNLILLIGVLFMPEQKGAHRWYDLKFMDFQPSELAKIIMIICLACFLYSKRGEMHLFNNFLQAAVFMAIPTVLVLVEPDLGTSMVFIFVFFAMLFIGGMSKKLLLVIFLIGLILLLAMFGILFHITDGFQHVPEDLPDYLPLKPYQITRLIIFMNPYMDPLGAGYHMIQSEVAIGSGGFWGKGLGQGSQVQGNFLPEHHTDFIFSVVGEELGFVGTCFLLLLYLFLILNGLRIAFRSKDSLGCLLVIGVMAMFLFQIFINVGMTIGMMPITGLPFPLLSYGGSGMLINMISLGLVFSVNLRSSDRLFE